MPGLQRRRWPSEKRERDYREDKSPITERSRSTDSAARVFAVADLLFGSAVIKETPEML